MPKVCIYRPNRSTPRRWDPKGLQRIIKDVCKEYGPEITEKACREALLTCSKSQCICVDAKMLDALIYLLMAVSAIAYVLSLAVQFLDLPVIKWVWRKYPAAALFLDALRALGYDTQSVAAFGAEVRALEAALKQIKVEQTGF